MNLTVDHSLAAGQVSVPCLECGEMLPLAQAQIDLDGPAFKAYYHVSCLPDDAMLAQHTRECRANDCRRRA